MNTPRTNHAHGFNLAVAQELDAARVAYGWTVENLAAQLPMSLRSLERYLTGEAAVTVENLEIICEAIGVPMGEVTDPALKAYRAGPIKPRPRPRLRPGNPDSSNSGVDALADTLRRARDSRTQPPTKPRTLKDERGRSGTA